MTRQQRTPPSVKPVDGPVTLVKEFNVITPMIGGGVDAQETDPQEPARSATVRGHLRFWWRATRGAAYETIEALRAAEAKVWGSTEEPGRVVTLVETTRAGGPTPGTVHTYKDSESVAPPYGGFPVAGKPLWQGVRFKLTLRFPEKLRADVEAALWAFSCFGGIGARSRRGFGAVQEVGTEDWSREEWMSEISKGLSRHVVGGKPPVGVPTLVGVENPDTNNQMWKISAKPSRDAIEAWFSAVAKLKVYRQNRRKGEGNTPGRSYWPEPDLIRRKTERRANSHRKDVNQVDRVPRAVFGLPIVFHFKDGNDPGDVHLIGASMTPKIDRLASPLILRPFRVKTGAHSIAIVLGNSFLNPDDLVPGGLKLQEQGTNRSWPVKPKMTTEEVKSLGTDKIQSANILTDFLDYFKA